MNTMTRLNTAIAVIVMLFALAANMGGCAAPSMWERNYVGSQATALPPTAPVQVRRVAWERVQGVLKDIESQAAASDIHPDDWSEGKKAEVRGQMLKGLQIADNPASVEILGRSNFRTTRAINPEISDDAALPDFARKLGATRVAWTSSYLGKADAIVQEPVSTWSQGTTWGSRDDRGRYRSREYSENSTTWIPIRVQADEYAYVAYFLRDERN